jgi:hypothetical protein
MVGRTSGKEETTEAIFDPGQAMVEIFFFPQLRYCH